MINNLSLGKFGENIAVSKLRLLGYKIIKKNFRTKFGELDIIAKDKDVIVFIEVKTRKTSLYGLPEESVTKAKLHKMEVSAEIFLKRFFVKNQKYRFEVFSINMFKDSYSYKHIKSL